MKYKLIKEYPNGPKINTIIQRRIIGEDYWSYDNSSVVLLVKDHPENYPEFWELVVEYPIGTKVLNSQINTIYTKKEDGWYKPSEKTAYTDEMIIKSNYINIIEDKVVKKDYEILSLVLSNKYCFLDKDNLFKYKENLGNKHGSTLEQCLNIKWQIYSVKRLSDGEIFTIGDKVQTSMNLTINGFIIIDNELLINPFEIIGTITLNRITKTKTPLFTTEDGVNIYTEDIIWHTNLNLGSLKNCVYSSKVEYKESFKPVKGLYSTKEKAEEYILMNKPCLSYNEVLNAVSIKNKNTFDTLKELVKSKIK